MRGEDVGETVDKAFAAAPKRELLVGALLTGVVAALLLGLGPSPGDAPAHLYRTLLVQQGALVWDNLWYAGHYPLASYSLLYYLPAAVVGNLPLVFAAAVASTAIFASIAYREWGDAARWPCRLFGVFAAAPMFTGLYAYSLGFTAMLGALWAFQRRRTWLGSVLSVLTLGFSPLAFSFLCLVLLAVVVAQRHVSRRTVLVATVLVLTAGVELAVMLLFPSKGVYPFVGIDFAATVALCAVGAALTWRVPRGRTLTTFFVLWGITALFCYVVPTPVGDNLTRLRAFVLPLMLLAAILSRFRPRWLVVLALVGGFAYNLVPYFMLIPYRLDNRPASVAFWRPALGYLHQHLGPQYRVEVVPTAARWESYWVPGSGIPLARGWYRQLEIADYPTLFHGRLTATTYVAWLRSLGVKYVLLPATKLDFDGGPAEAKLIRSGAGGLAPVFTSTTGTIYELPNPVPLLTGPAPANITSFGHVAISGWVSKPGRYLLRIRYSDYWHIQPRIGCISKAGGGMITLNAHRAGSFTLRFPETPSAVVASFKKRAEADCA